MTPTAPTPTGPAADATPVLRVEHLAISFAHPRPAVEDVSLTLAPGEILALVGESGSGKSMTARAVLGLLPEGATPTGSITVDGEEILGASEKVLDRVRGNRIAMVFQEPQTALNPVRTVGWQLGEALRAHGDLDRRGRRARAAELLAEVEIPDPQRRLDQYPHQLSGGQKQRVVLALALAGQPDVLLADEPTTALDVTVQAEILRLLRRLRDRTGAGILLITHNMGVVAEIADRVAVLQHGLVLEEATTEELFDRPRHPYTRGLLDAVLRLPEPDEAPPVALRSAPSPLAVRFEEVAVAYGSRKRERALPAISGISLDVAEGEVVGLVGESGSGKTTLGRLAARLVPLTEGSVHVGGTDLFRASAAQLRDVRRDLAVVHQDPAASLDPRMSVEAAIREPLDIHRIGSKAGRDGRVAELLDAVRLPRSYAQRRPHELSGGQRQRVALARALILGPKLLVADEPTSALDVSVQAEVLALFRQLHDELGFACLFISHDLAVVHEVADRVAVLQGGRLVEVGSAADVFTRPRADYTRRLLAALPSGVPRGRDKTDDERAS